MKNILIIGTNSFVANNLNIFLKKFYKVKKIDLSSINNIKLSKYDCLINCSIQKKYILENYKIKNDIDYFIANKIKNLNIQFIFISTRKVYRPKANIKETDKKIPFSNYGKNKRSTEKRLKKILGKNLLILRTSNIIGLKKKIKHRKVHHTFIDIFKENIKNGFVYDNENNFKDFITINQFSEAIKKSIKQNLYGTYNLSMGRKIYLKDIISWLLVYNKKKLIYKKIDKFSKKNNVYKSFYLNNNKLKKKININFKINDLKKECFKISKKMFIYK